MAKLKRKLTSRITVIAVALLMVLTVGLLGACNITDTLQEGLDALRAEVVYLYNNGGATEAQLDEKQERIDEFRNGANGTLTPAQKEQLDKVQGKVDYMRNGKNPIRGKLSLDEYTAEFFKTHSLVLIGETFSAIYSTENISIMTVAVENNELTFVFEIISGRSAPAFTTKLFFVEIPKIVLENYALGRTLQVKSVIENGDPNRNTPEHEVANNLLQYEVAHQMGPSPLHNSPIEGFLVITSLEDLTNFIEKHLEEQIND